MGNAIGFDIGKFHVGGDKAMIVAELSCNHMQDITLARRTILLAAESGADAIKLQTLDPASITIDCDNEYFRIESCTAWDGMTLFELYKKAVTPWQWHKELRDLSESLGLVFFSSPFSIEAVDFLDYLGAPAFKIASFEITDLELISYAASKGKPIILSTGIATWEDIEDAVNACRNVGNDEIAILKCTSSYPAPIDEANLATIPDMQEKFNVITGLSDHTKSNTTAIVARSLGAKIIEKHFIADKSLESLDAGFSLDPVEFRSMVSAIRNAEAAIGKPDYEISKTVEKNRVFARSLFVVSDIEKGNLFTKDNVKSIRPGYGLKPKHINNIIGKKATRDIKRGEPMDWNMVGQG